LIQISEPVNNFPDFVRHLVKQLKVLQLQSMRRELGACAMWYNEHRPNQALGGRTPREGYIDFRPANARPRFEPRGSWPPRGPCASPRVPAQSTVRRHITASNDRSEFGGPTQRSEAEGPLRSGSVWSCVQGSQAEGPSRSDSARRWVQRSEGEKSNPRPWFERPRPGLKSPRPRPA
jgi:hypothetical protein